MSVGIRRLFSINIARTRLEQSRKKPLKNLGKFKITLTLLIPLRIGNFKGFKRT